MSIHLRCLVLVILLFTSTNALFAQTKNDKPATASVTGRITFNNQPLAGITVTLEMPMNLGVGVTNTQRQPVTTKTDANGYYRLQGIATGYYLVWPRALAYVMSVEGLSGRPGRTVSLSDGEAVEGLDFALVKGGVISGKITDHLGRPVVLQRVNLRRYTTSNETAPFLFPSTKLTIFETDDRGIYRLFGLPAGRYNVSVGGDRIGQGGEAYGRTFYPGVRDEIDAKAIEVTEGSETLDIDIKLSEPEKLYEARGRVLDASTGTPLANVRLAYNASRSRQEIGELTDAQGEFILQGLLAGKYTALLRTDSESEYYSDPITFEIQDHDVGGLEVKAYRSASISGIIVFEGTTDLAVLKRMPMVRLDVSPSPQQRRPVSFSFSSQMAKPDGTFRLAGLRPGTHRINANDTGGNSPFRFVRIERDGVNIGTDIDLAAGEQVAGIKIVLAYGAGTIRGQIKVVNGSLRPDLQITVFATPLQGTSRGKTRPAQVDAQGKFVMEGLVPGEYELRPFVVLTAGMPQPPNFVPVQQKVTVGTGEISVTLTLDFGER